MKHSKLGLPHVSAGHHLRNGATDVPSVAALVMKAFDLADQGLLTISHPVSAGHKHELAKQLNALPKLGPHQSFMGFRARGDIAANGIPTDPHADFPGGVCDLPSFKAHTYRALVCQLTGLLELGELHQADTDEEVKALEHSVDLSAHDDVFMGFIRTEN